MAASDGRVPHPAMPRTPTAARVLTVLGSVALLVSLPVSLVCSAIITDTCVGDGCGVEGSVIVSRYCAVVAVAVGLAIVITVASVPRWRHYRGLQVKAGWLALLGGIWPLLWVFVFAKMFFDEF